jgi:hypothetical protein
MISTNTDKFMETNAFLDQYTSQDEISKYDTANFERTLKRLPGDENRVIKIKFRDLVVKERNGDNLLYRLKAMVRRYFCEVRDNYITPARFRLAGFRPLTNDLPGTP